MSPNSDSPFHVGSAIDDPRLFVGRQEILKLLRDRLTGAQPTSINIVGLRRTGKSSLLLHFANTYRQRVSNPDRFAVAYLSLQDAACNTQAKFYGSVAKVLSANISPEQRELQRILRVKEWEQVKFNEVIQAFKSQGILPVLCIDNFEELLERQQEFPNDFYDNLRFLAGNNYLMVIVASCEMLDIYSKRKQITSDFFNVFHFVDLNGGLTELEAKALVSLKNAAGQGLSDELQQRALHWGKREPFLLQLAGETLWEMQRDRKSLQWAQKAFKAQAKRFNFQPKSPLLSTLYKIISQLGGGILWFNKNRKEMQQFWVGLIFLAVVAGILIAFFSGAIDFEQIKLLFQKSSGK
jgi:AAA+ ATPase superfamily predicted ATPase